MMLFIVNNLKTVYNCADKSLLTIVTLASYILTYVTYVPCMVKLKPRVHNIFMYTGVCIVDTLGPIIHKYPDLIKHLAKCVDHAQ